MVCLDERNEDCKKLIIEPSLSLASERKDEKQKNMSRQLEYTHVS